MSGFAALVLAGSRAGAEDPVAAYGGAAHKALIVLQGQTLLARVTCALRDAGAARIAVVSSHPQVRAEAARLGVETLDEAAGPSLSVQAAAGHLGTPLLVTTADHALLEAAWVERFLADVPADADVAALVAARATVEAAAPTTQRTWLKLAGGHWSAATCSTWPTTAPSASSTSGGAWRPNASVPGARRRSWGSACSSATPPAGCRSRTLPRGWGRSPA